MDWYVCGRDSEDRLKMIQKRPQFALRHYFCVIKKHHGLFTTEYESLQEILLFVFIFSIVN